MKDICNNNNNIYISPTSGRYVLCPINLQGQVGWGPQQPDLVSGIPDHGMVAGTR